MAQLTQATLLAALSCHIGRERGVSISNLVYEATGHAPTPEAERRAREVVMELRLAGHHICAHPESGYYIAASAEELNEACRFLVERAMTSLKQVAAMKRVSMPDLYGQLHLPN